MQRKSVVVLGVVVLACVALIAQERRRVVLEIGLPNGAVPQVQMEDGGTGTVDLPKMGKFGFVPRVKEGTVAVEVFDMNQTPHRQIDRVDATIGGEKIQTNTKPQFSIRVVRVAAE